MQALLVHLIEETVVANANHLNHGLSKKAFSAHFPRFVVPDSQSAGSSQPPEDVLTDTWVSGSFFPLDCH